MSANPCPKMPSRTYTDPEIYLCNRRSLPYGKLPEEVRKRYDFFFVQESLLRDIKAPKESPLIAVVVGDWGQGKSTLKGSITRELRNAPAGSSPRVYTMNEVLSAGGGLAVRSGDVLIIDEVEDIVDKSRVGMNYSDKEIQKFFDSLKDIANMIGVDATVILLMSVSARHSILDPGGMLERIAPGTRLGIMRRIKTYDLERPSKLEYLSIIHCHLTAMSLQQLTNRIPLVDVLYYGLPALRSIGSGIVWDLLCELPQDEERAASTILYKMGDRDVLQRITGKEIPRLIVGDVNALDPRERSLLLRRISFEDPGGGAIRGRLIPYHEYEELRQEYLSSSFDDEEKRNNALSEMLGDEDYVTFYVPQDGSADFLDRIWIFIPSAPEEVYPMMRSDIWKWLEGRVDGGKEAWVASWSWLGKYLNLEIRDLIIKIDRNKLTEREVDDFVKNNLTNDQLVMQSFGRFIEISLENLIGNKLMVPNMIDNSKMEVSCISADPVPMKDSDRWVLETEWQVQLGGNRQLKVPMDILVAKKGIPPSDLRIDELKPIIVFSSDEQLQGGNGQKIVRYIELSTPEKRLLLQLHFLDKGAEPDLDRFRTSLAYLIDKLRDEISDALSPYITLAWMDSIVDVDKQKRIGNWLFYYLRDGPVELDSLYSAIKEDLLDPIYPYFVKRTPTEDLESPSELKKRMDYLCNNGLLRACESGSSLYVEESYSEFLLTISKMLIFILSLYQQDRNKTMKELIDFMFDVEDSRAKSAKIVECISGSKLMSTIKAQSLLYFATMNGALVRAAFDADPASFCGNFLDNADKRLHLLYGKLTEFEDDLKHNKYARYYLTAKERDVKIIDARSIADYLEGLMNDAMNKKSSPERDPKMCASILRKSIAIQNILETIQIEYHHEPYSENSVGKLEELYSKLRANIDQWNADYLSKFISYSVDSNKLDNIVSGNFQIKNDIKRFDDMLKRASLGCMEYPCIAEELKALVDRGSNDEHVEKFREYVGNLTDYLDLKNRHSITLSEFLKKISIKNVPDKYKTIIEELRLHLADLCSEYSDNFKELCEFLRLSNILAESTAKIQTILNKIGDVAAYKRPDIDRRQADDAINNTITSLNKYIEELEGLGDELSPEFFEKCNEGTSPSSYSAPREVVATGGSTIGPSTNPAFNSKVEDELDIILDIVENYHMQLKNITTNYNIIKSNYDKITSLIDDFAKSIKELHRKREGDLLRLKDEKIINIMNTLCNDEKYRSKLGDMCTELNNITNNIAKTDGYIVGAMKSLAALIRDASCQLRDAGLKNADPSIKVAVGKNILDDLKSKSNYGSDYLNNAENGINHIKSDLEALNYKLEKFMNEIAKNVEKYKHTLEKLGKPELGCKFSMDIAIIQDCLDMEIRFRNEILKRLEDIADKCSLVGEDRKALSDLVERGSARISELIESGVNLSNIACALRYIDAVIRIE